MRAVSIIVVMAGWLVASPAGAAREPAQQPAAPAPADPNEWTIDSTHSQAGFAVKHMLVSTVRGKLGPVTGKVWYDGKDAASIRADVTIDVTGVDTGVAARDADLRSENFLMAAQYPTIAFKSTRVEPGAPGQFKMIGDLTIRAVTKSVTLDVEGPAPALAAQGRLRTGAQVTLTLNRFDFGLKYNSLIESVPIVGAEVKVTVDLEATKRLR